MADRTAPPFDIASLSQQKLADVVASCQTERTAYRRTNIDSSPCCVEIFRRAFAGDQAAWAAVRATFERQVRGWIGAQSLLEPDDIVQEAFLALSRTAPARYQELVANATLTPLLSFWRECTKNALLQLLRKERRHAQSIPIDESLGYGDTSSPEAAADLRLDLIERIHQLLETDAERLVFQCRFVCNIKPQDIAERYPELFISIRDVYNIIQRVTRRLSNDEVLQELATIPAAARRKPKPAVSLAMSMLSDAEDSAGMDEPCLIDDELLLDYITGVAAADLCSAIERSPACLAAARRLGRTILPLMQQIYRATCPAEATLVAYQQRQLAGNDQLAVRAHLAICPLCQEEYRLLETLDATPLNPPSLARRILEALLVPPLQLPQPVRGELQHYQAPHISINISVRKTSGKPRTWTLRGQIRTPDGLLLPGVLEAASLRPFDQPDQPAIEGAIDPNGSFVFQSLPAATYSLSLLTPEEEYIIRRIAIGNMDE